MCKTVVCVCVFEGLCVMSDSKVCFFQQDCVVLSGELNFDLNIGSLGN